jgi:hypothetical protein
MTKLVVAATALIASFFASTASFADGLQLNITYGAKAEKAMTETYGTRERGVIAELLQRNLARELGNQAARVDVVINDVVPNRPTFKQLGDKPGLSFQSFGIGGADVTGKAYDSAGNLVGEVSYDWYGDILWADTAWTWTDADRALYQFSRRLAAVVPG